MICQHIKTQILTSFLLTSFTHIHWNIGFHWLDWVIVWTQILSKLWKSLRSINLYDSYVTKHRPFTHQLVLGCLIWTTNYFNRFELIGIEKSNDCLTSISDDMLITLRGNIEFLQNAWYVWFILFHFLLFQWKDHTSEIIKLIEKDDQKKMAWNRDSVSWNSSGQWSHISPYVNLDNLLITWLCS